MAIFPDPDNFSIIDAQARSLIITPGRMVGIPDRRPLAPRLRKAHQKDLRRRARQSRKAGGRWNSVGTAFQNHVRIAREKGKGINGVFGRGSWIRTNDLQYPKLPRYQAALYPDDLGDPVDTR